MSRTGPWCADRELTDEPLDCEVVPTCPPASSGAPRSCEMEASARKTPTLGITRSQLELVEYRKPTGMLRQAHAVTRSESWYLRSGGSRDKPMKEIELHVPRRAPLPRYWASGEQRLGREWRGREGQRHESRSP